MLYSRKRIINISSKVSGNYAHPTNRICQIQEKLILGWDNEYIIYVNIITEEKCHKFILLTRTSFIGQFVHPVGGEGMG